MTNELLDDRIDVHYKSIKVFDQEEMDYLLHYSTTSEMFMNTIWISILQTKLQLLVHRIKQSIPSESLQVSLQKSVN